MLFKKYIRFFEDKDWFAFSRFVKKYFYILSDKNFFTWQYTPPNVAGKNPHILILYVHKKLVGYLGTIPLTLNYFGKDRKGVCLANLLVDPVLRGKGAGIDFVERAADTADIVYSVGLNESMQAIYRQAGWTVDVFLRRFVFIFNSKKITRLIKRKIDTSSFSKDVRLKNRFTFTPCREFDANINRFWESIKHKYPITISRTSAYLNWRYAEHPFFTYDIFLITDDKEIKAYIVLRIEEVEGYTVGRIIDFISTDDAEMYTLMNACIFAKEKGADMIDFLFSGLFHTDTLCKVGFVKAEKEPHSLIPIRFSPIDASVRTIHFAYTFGGDIPKNGRLNNSDNWYITKGDGDQDRPNPH